MLAERFLERRYRVGKEEERKEWKEWALRFQAATKADSPFDEPMPGEREQGDKR